MLIIVEEPSRKKTRHEKELLKSIVSAHVATVTHRSRRPHDVYARILPTRPVRELRALAFYHERTSLEWAGWNDARLWTEAIPQAAATFPMMYHSLIGLASFHESFEMPNQALKKFSIAQAQMCITWFNEHHHDVPLSVVMMVSVIITELSGLMNDRTHQQAIKAQNALIDHGEADEHYLKTLMRRQRSRHCQLISPLPLLRQAKIIPSSGPIRFNFDDLWQARESLEGILNTIAHQVKSDMPVQSSLLHHWLQSFVLLRDTSDKVSWLALRAGYSLAIVQIETMYSTTESVYDQYDDAFTYVAEAYGAMLARRKGRCASRFSLDAGFLCLVGWSAIWCRNPSLRTRLIALLRASDSAEGAEGSQVWAITAGTAKQIEEQGIRPPPCSNGEIPEPKRIRLHTIAFYWKARLQRIDFLRYPYTEDILETVWIPHLGSKYQYQDNASDSVTGSDTKPDWIMGPAYTSFAEGDDTYFTLQAPDFYFALPKA